MSYDTPELTEQEVLQHALGALHEHLPLHAAGYACTTSDLLKVLLGVAVNRGTLESVCADLVGTPEPQTSRNSLNAQLRVAELPELERRLNAALAAERPPRGWRQAHEVALDSHDRPYYGKAPQAAGVWVRSQAKDGTPRFYRRATASLGLKGLRVTVALHFVLPPDDPVSVLGRLRARVRELGLRVPCLLRDKGFAGMAVLEYLTGRGQPALMACPIRGTKGGTRALCQGRKSSCTTPTFNGAQGAEFTAALAVCRVFTTARRTQRLPRRAAWLLFSVIPRTLSPRSARQL